MKSVKREVTTEKAVRAFDTTSKLKHDAYQIWITVLKNDPVYTAYINIRRAVFDS